MAKILITTIKTIKTVKTVKTKTVKTVKTIRSPCKYPDRELISPCMSQIDRRLLRELCEDTHDTVKRDTIEQDTVDDNYFWDNSHVWNKNYKT